MTVKTDVDTKKELTKCSLSCHYFIVTYVKIYDPSAKEWIPFSLWVDQQATLDTILAERLVVILKARQLGLTWLVLAYALWLMLFRATAITLLFSRRDTEAKYLLSEERLKGVYTRLPDWMQFEEAHQYDAAHNWILPNGSAAKAFPTSAGDSYAATLAIVDEADLAPDLNRLMRAVKPTIDGGGQMILLSRSDKSRPMSEFKNIYRAAKQKLNGWTSVFLPWYSRPSRDQEWYEAQRADILNRTTSLDDLHEQYPATDTEALSPRTLDKRIAPKWLEQCYQEQDPLEDIEAAPAISGLRIYKEPEPDHAYRIGLDPAEGNPTSDDSAFVVVDEANGEEIASFKGKVQPSTLANYGDQVGQYYNNAGLLPERNNHGHAVILWFEQNSELEVLKGEDGRPGWLSNSLGKTRMYDDGADVFRDGDAIVHSFDTYFQLASIEGSTLRAPKGQLDDLADSYVLAQVARRISPQWVEQEFISL